MEAGEEGDMEVVIATAVDRRVGTVGMEGETTGIEGSTGVRAVVEGLNTSGTSGRASPARGGRGMITTDEAERAAVAEAGVSRTGRDRAVHPGDGIDSFCNSSFSHSHL